MRRQALEWKCGAGCRPQPWKDSSKGLPATPLRKEQNKMSKHLALCGRQFYIARVTNLQLGAHWDCGKDFPHRLRDLHRGFPCITVCFCEPVTEMCLCVTVDSLGISKASSRQRTLCCRKTPEATFALNSFLYKCRENT